MLFKMFYILFWVLLIGSLAKADYSKSFFDEELANAADFIIQETNRDNIGKFLRHLTLHPHLGGTPEEWETANWVENLWKEQGLDEVHKVGYDVLLSYPHKEKSNYVRIKGENGGDIWVSQSRTKPLHAPEEFSEDVPPNFNAYSKAGNVQGDIVYAHFGTEEDMKELTDKGVNISGKIVIARYGKVFRANIAKSAENRGAIAVILYSDPINYAQEGSGHVYPYSVWMPGSAAAAGTVYLGDGDPLTPNYPSIESAFRIPEEEIQVPQIPVMPISYDDAKEILERMGGEEAPEEWQGSLNLTYRLGPGLQEPQTVVNVEVNTQNKRTTTYNVIGVIKGSEEPDRYVILGNHRDAWIFGSIDPSSGTAAMMELSRTLMQYKNQTGWRPRRSIVFCSWGSEEYGLIGSQEWTEHFSSKLMHKSVAYLNVDMAIEGNYTLRTKSAPLLYTLSKETTKLIPNPDPEEVSQNRTTVFDTWALRRPDDSQPGEPKMDNIGSGSDYKPLQHNLGVPSLDCRYTHSKEMFAQPLYHTLYETYYLAAELFDQGWHFHASVTQMWGIIALALSDSQILPFSLDEYAHFIASSQEGLKSNYEDLIRDRNLTLDSFLEAGDKFSSAVAEFTEEINLLNTSNPLTIRQINDKLMLLERAFIDKQGLPSRPTFNHVVVAPSARDSYAGIPFTGLVDTLEQILELNDAEETNHKWREFEEHLAACTHHLLMAANSLSENLWA